ncbi:MAG: DEAD/DEAH box helicase [Deltaproteobacteria bacterium]|jgi:hypothetical protein|nr:DEAD/DEAH box helicase [Deltaproteobacteria bacterium]
MLAYHPVFSKEGAMYVLGTWTTPLLKGPPRLHIGDESHELEEGPPYDLIGTPIWNKAAELAALGRELHQRLVSPEALKGTGAFLASLSRGDLFAEAPLKFLARFRPALEAPEPTVLFAFRLSGSGHGPMGLPAGDLRRVRSFLRDNMVLGLFHQADVPYFTGRGDPPPVPEAESANGTGARDGEPEGGKGDHGRAVFSRPGFGAAVDAAASPGAPAAGAPGGPLVRPLAGWKAWNALRAWKKGPPYQLERTVVALPHSYWMKGTAELFGMIPLKWADSGGFFHGSPSAHSWGDVLSKVAPSYGFSGKADELFPVPILSGSLLDMALSSHRKEIFLNLNSREPVPDRHILATGPTGTGKTLLGTFALINECLERKQPVVYLGPTRMLVEDAAQEFKRLLAMLEKGLGKGVSLIKRDDVIVSTGEAYQDDARIAAGDFRAAFVVYEKVSNFFLGSSLIKHLGMALIDELHMLGDRTRGGSLDATLGRLIHEAEARNRENPLRLMCLSTGAMAEDQTILGLLARGRAKGGAPLRPLVLSVYERPQRLLMYVQPTASRRRFRPVHVSRLQDRLGLGELILAQGEGASFDDCLDGWIPGHEKIIYASYSWNSLLSFVNKALDMGRGEVPSILRDGFFLKELEASFARAGLSEGSVDFYMHCARRGIFFHFSGLEKETRRLMAEGYRRFRPVDLEPFVLCATETIAYGVNLPADALFLETVMWPRSRFDRFYSIESLTNNEFKNLVGRVGRHGHIKPGIIPTVLVNWKMGRESVLEEAFPRLKQEMARLCSSQPVAGIDCRELQGLMASERPLASLAGAPAALGRFFLLAFLHACAIGREQGGDGSATLSDALGFLGYTYAYSSLPSGSGSPSASPGPEAAKRVGANLRAYFRDLSGVFGELVVSGQAGVPDIPGNGKDGEGRKLFPGELAQNLAQNGTNPLTLLELDGFMGIARDGSTVDVDGDATDNPSLFGLKALLFSPLCAETRGIFSRGRFDSLGKGRPPKGRAGLLSEEERRDLYLWYSSPLTTALGALGIGEGNATGIPLRVHAIVTGIVRDMAPKARLSARRMETVRDNLLPYVYRTLLSLLLWVSGVRTKDILEVSYALRRLQVMGQQGPRHISEGQGTLIAFLDWLRGLLLPEGAEGGGAQASPTGLAEAAGSPAGEAFGQEDLGEAQDEEEGVFAGPRHPARPEDGQAFDRRFSEKIVLVLDSYLRYASSMPMVGEERLRSLRSMMERVRHGMGERELAAYLPYLASGGRLSREEWLEDRGQAQAAP